MELQSPTMVEERTPVPQIGGGYMISTNLKQDPHPQHNHLFRFPQHHFSVSLHQKRVKRWREVVDDTMGWFQQEEPVRRRPPRQLRSRTIGQVTWDSKFGYRNYDIEEGVLSREIQELLPIKSQDSWYGVDTKERWTEQVRQLLYDPRPNSEGTSDMGIEQEIQLQ